MLLLKSNNKMGTIKNFVTKTLTTGGLALGVYGSFWLGNLVSERLNLTHQNLEGLIGSIGEKGLDGAIQYGIPLAAVYGLRELAKYAERKFE